MRSLFIAMIIGSVVGSPFCQNIQTVVPCDVVTFCDGVVTVETRDNSHEVFQYYGDTEETHVLVTFDTMGTNSVYDDIIIDVK